MNRCGMCTRAPSLTKRKSAGICSSGIPPLTKASATIVKVNALSGQSNSRRWNNSWRHSESSVRATNSKALSMQHREFKPLAGIAVAAALGSDTCTQLWTKMAREGGVSTHETVEAIMVARYMKQATVIDTVSGNLRLIIYRRLFSSILSHLGRNERNDCHGTDGLDSQYGHRFRDACV